MKEMSKGKKILVAFLMATLIFFAGYTLAEEKTQDRLEEQAKTGIVHLNGEPYRIQIISLRKEVHHANRLDASK